MPRRPRESQVGVIWGAKVEFNAYILILKKYFLILEIHFLILAIEFPILENVFF